MHCKNLNVKVNQIGEGKAKQKKLIFKKGEFIMRKRFSRTAALVLAGVIAAGALTGCGNGGKSNSGQTQAVSTETGSTDAGASETTAASVSEDAGLHNLEDGVLDIGTGITWDTLTPLRSNVGNNAPFAMAAYETLARLTENKEYIPQVAKSWVAGEDGKTFDVEIYDYVTDSAGNAITASDIVWMIKLQQEAALKPAFAKVESVEQTGDYTLRITMKKDMVGAFEAILTNTFVVSQKAYEESKDQFATEIISTSPYKVTEFVSGSVLSFEKRDDYWQKPELIPEETAANVDKLSFHVIKEASQAGIALETGDIDAFVQLDQNTAVQFVDNPAFSMEANSYINGYQLYFSGGDNRNIATDENLRKAICYAIDTDGLIKGVFAGYGKSMHDPIADTSVGYLEKWKDEEYYPYDVEKAKELISQSNYKGEELEFLATSSSTTQRICQMIQGYLLQVGINVKLNLVDQALYTATRLDGTQYDMTINTVGGETLPDHWSIRYDYQAYKTGDATARHDEALGELLYKTWTKEGFTEENIDEVHNYLKDHMYAYGMVQPENIDVWRTDLGITKTVHTNKGSIDFTSCQYQE